MKTIFLTGSTGFVGANLAYALLKQGYALKLLVRNGKRSAGERLRESLGCLLDGQDEFAQFKERVEVIPGDITLSALGIRPEVFRRLLSEVDLVFHNAAQTGFKVSTNGDMEKCNVKGTENVLNFTLKLPKPRLCHMSTAYVCGQRSGDFLESDLDAGQDFNNVYEESKFKAEKLVSEYREKYNIKTTIYRPSVIVGDSTTGRTSNFRGIYTLIKSISFFVELFSGDLQKGGERALSAGAAYHSGKLNIPLRIPSIPGKTLNVIPIDYVVDVILTHLKEYGPSGKTFHIINPSLRTLQWFAETICSLFNITGIGFVDRSELESKPLTEWERFFLSTIRPVEPYLRVREPRFSDKNTREILKGADIKCPEISEGLFKTLFNYYISNTKFGK